MNTVKSDCTINLKPSEDRKSLTVFITSTNEIGVREMIKILAGLIKQQVEEHKITFESVAWGPNDQVSRSKEDLQS